MENQRGVLTEYQTQVLKLIKQVITNKKRLKKEPFCLLRFDLLNRNMVCINELISMGYVKKTEFNNDIRLEII